MMREVLTRRFARLAKEQAQRVARTSPPAGAEARAADAFPHPEERPQGASRRTREGDEARRFRAYAPILLVLRLAGCAGGSG